MFLSNRSLTRWGIPGHLPAVDPNPAGEADGGGASDLASSGGDASGDLPADDLEGLKRALKAEREQRRQEEARRKSLEGQLKEVGNVDPKLLEDARQRAREAETQRQMIEQQTKLRLVEQEQKYQDQLSRVTADLQAAKTAAEREALRIKTEREFLASKGLTTASSIDGRTPFDYVWQVFADQFAEDASGLYLVDAAGNPRLDDETGRRITPGQFFAKLRQDPVHGAHFQPEYGSGSGARAGRDGRVTTTQDLMKVPKNQLFRDAFSPRRGTA